LADLNSFFVDAPAGARRFGVVGWPLDYSLSPSMHNAALSHFSIPAAYRALRVPPEGWDDFLQGVEHGGLDGFNVTIPFKEKVLGLAQELKGTVAVCRAANTLVRGPRGWEAHNTDGDGLLEDLREHGIGWEGQSVVLLGAGGAARAALFALGACDRAPRDVVLVNRSLARAESLAREFRAAGVGTVEVRVHSTVSEATKRATLLINATAVGLKEGDPCGVPSDVLRADLSVYDMVYHRETFLVKKARAVGALAVGGLGMLINQGALAFEHWFRDDLKKVNYDSRQLREIMGAAARATLNERKTP
jgi:shikimate dehydrogenase